MDICVNTYLRGYRHVYVNQAYLILIPDQNAIIIF